MNNEEVNLDDIVLDEMPLGIIDDDSDEEGEDDAQTN